MDSRRRFRAIRQKLVELAGYPTGRQLQHLQVLAMFISGIVGSKSTQAREVAKKTVPGAKVESRVKRLERWYRNAKSTYELHYLPYVEHLLAHLSGYTLALDASEVGRGCTALMVNLIYQKRAIPLLGVVVDQPKGHLPAATHSELLERLPPILPPESPVVFLGDGEFDSVALQAHIQALAGWEYVCRTAQSTLVCVEGEWLQLDDLLLLPDMALSLPDVLFTEQAYGPVPIIGLWDKEQQEPIYLVTSFFRMEEACHWYRRRMRIETFFSDQKSRGLQLDKSHLDDPQRLSRVLIAACLAYIWMIYLGVQVHVQDWVSIIHRTDRCDLSLFQLGLDLLEHFLNEELEIDVGFRLPEAFLFA